MSSQQKIALTVASAALVVGAIDHTAVTIAAPDFQRDFGLDLLDIRVLFVSFWFFDIAALLFSGRLSDAWSRQRVMVLGFGTFVVGSAMALVSPNLEILVFARSVQGLGAGLIFGPTLAILTDNFPAPRLGWIFGVWAAIGGVALALAPVLGGVLVELSGWRTIFAATGLLAALAFFFATRLALSVRANVSFQFDWLGIGLILLVIGQLAVALLRLESRGTDPILVVLVISAGLMLIGFGFSQRREEAGVLPRPIVTATGFAVGTSLATIAYALAHFIIVAIVIYFYAVLGLTFFQTGAALLAYSVVWFAASFLGGRLVDGLGIRMMALLGTLIVALGVALLALWVTEESYPLVAAALAVFALGNAALMPAVNKGAMAAVRPEDRGLASGSNMMFRLVGALFGFAGGLAMVAYFDEKVLPGIDLVSVQLSSSVDLLIRGDVPERLREFLSGNYADALATTLWWSCSVALLGVILALFARWPHSSTEPATEAAEVE